MCACVRACVHACVRACVCVCVLDTKVELYSEDVNKKEEDRRYKQNLFETFWIATNMKHF